MGRIELRLQLTERPAKIMERDGRRWHGIEPIGPVKRARRHSGPHASRDCDADPVFHDLQRSADSPGEVFHGR